MACKTCPIPMPYDGKSGCLLPGEPRFAGTACVNCGYVFECEGDYGCTTVADWDPNGRVYPICHPQDCRGLPTMEQKAAWDEKYRHKVVYV